MDRSVVVRDGSKGERITVPFKTLMGHDFFKGMYELDPNSKEEIDVKCLGMDLFTFVKLITRNIPLSTNEIILSDKFLFPTSLTHFSDRTIISGCDSQRLHQDVIDGRLNFEMLPSHFQKSIILEAVLRGTVLVLDAYFRRFFIEYVVRDPWMFYPNYKPLYTRYIFYSSDFLKDKLSEKDIEAFNDTCFRIQKVLDKNYSKSQLIEILHDGIEPYVLEYIQTPNSFPNGVSKDFYKDHDGSLKHVLVPILNFRNYPLARKMIKLGVDVNAPAVSGKMLLEICIGYQSWLRNIKKHIYFMMELINFLLDHGYNPTRSNTNILAHIYEIVKFRNTKHPFVDINKYYLEFKEHNPLLILLLQKLSHFKLPNFEIPKSVTQDTDYIFTKLISDHILPRSV